MHSVRLEPTQLILIGTRTTYYQATGYPDCIAVWVFQQETPADMGESGNYHTLDI